MREDEQRESEDEEDFECLTETARILAQNLENGEKEFIYDKNVNSFDCASLLKYIEKNELQLNLRSVLLDTCLEESCSWRPEPCMYDNLAVKLVGVLKKCRNLGVLEVKRVIEGQEMKKQLVELLRSCSTLTELHIQVKQLSKVEMMEEILECVFCESSVTKLSLHFETDVNKKLVSAISRNKSVKDLSLQFSSNFVPSEVFYEVLETLEKDNSLKKVSFSNDSSYLFPIEKFPLQNNHTIEYLFFSRFKFSENSVDQFAKFLSGNKFLKKLSLNSSDSSNKLTALIESVRAESLLYSIDLSCTSLKKEDVKSIIRMLERKTSLTSLDLERCSIGHFCAGIFHALKANKSLKKLNLTNNKMRERNLRRNFSTGSASIDSLCEMILVNDTLEELNLSSNNEIGKNGLGMILCHLCQNKSLKVLNCSGTMKPPSLIYSKEYGFSEEVTKFLESEACLTSLDISDNFASKGLDPVLKALRVNKNLKHVFLSGNGDFNQYYLATLIRENQSLETLGLMKGESMSHTLCESTLKALRENNSLTELQISEEKNPNYIASSTYLSLNLNEKAVQDEDIKQEILHELEFNKHNKKTKVLMMILQRRTGNLVHSLPRRLLIYLLTFLGRVKSRQNLMRESAKRKLKEKESGEKKMKKIK